MKFSDYQIAAMRTCSAKCRGNFSYSGHAIAGEAGEFTDLVKKFLYHETLTYDEFKAKAVLELGDVLWGLAQAADALGVDLGDVAASNIAKLRLRYPEKFTVADARARVDVYHTVDGECHVCNSTCQLGVSEFKGNSSSTLNASSRRVAQKPTPYADRSKDSTLNKDAVTDPCISCPNHRA